MRAIEILQEKLGPSLTFLHAKRLGALWRAVEGLLRGQELWLTELGRNLPGDCAIKHRVKAVDRFLGSPKLRMALPQIYAAVARFLLYSVDRPVVLVDWTGGESGHYVLSAKVAFFGRALSIFSRSYPEAKKANPDVERAFLGELKAIIPPRCRPVLVTDAGFLFKWIDSVRSFGWDYVARARLKKMVVTFEKGQSMRLREAYELANQKPRDLGTASLGKANPRSHRVVLSAKPKLKGRKNLGRKGKPRKSGVAQVARAAAREPLFLLTSLDVAPRVVVEIYETRMQIEQTFRDLKSYRYGWSTRHIRSKCSHRIDVLLLIGAIAALAMHVIGLAIRGGSMAYGLQANTERRRSVFSTFFLGRLALRHGLEATLVERSLRMALRKLILSLRSVHEIPA
jgi:Transposase DDE domain